MKREPDDIGCSFAVTLVALFVAAFLITLLVLKYGPVHDQRGGVNAPPAAKDSQDAVPKPLAVPALPRSHAASRSRTPSPGTGRLNWGALYECESTHNPRAVSPTGKFRGAFQFSLWSWREVGMTGDPIDYPYDVQLAAAKRLYARQGAGAWPYCGRRLK
jgi:hypothetical protein